MNVLVLDTETTTQSKGNPFNINNRLVCYSWWYKGKIGAARDSPNARLQMQRIIDEAELLVLFNAKFDLHWLRKCGIKYDHRPVYDCQLAEFILERQSNKYPSLEGACTKYGIGHKIDIIKNEYWDKGIDTPDIPWPILRTYAAQDADLTYKLYLAQQALLSASQSRLLRLQCQDLLVLAEMEWNGEVFDEKMCKQKSVDIERSIDKIIEEISRVYPDIPINFGSSQQTSAFLYGGVIKQAAKEHVGFFKSGVKAGQPKFKNIEILHTLPKLYEPLRDTELATEGVYSTTEDTLKQLRGKKGPIKSLLELAKLEKLNGTYYKGLPKLNAEMNWPRGKLHGQLNQCVAATGRLSSSRPNKQNFASEILDVFVTRY